MVVFSMKNMAPLSGRAAPCRALTRCMRIPSPPPPLRSFPRSCLQSSLGSAPTTRGRARAPSPAGGAAPAPPRGAHPPWAGASISLRAALSAPALVCVLARRARSTAPASLRICGAADRPDRLASVARRSSPDTWTEACGTNQEMAQAQALYKAAPQDAWGSTGGMPVSRGEGGGTRTRGTPLLSRAQRADCAVDAAPRN